MDQLILISDLGTSACKSILFDLKGRRVAKASCSYKTDRPRPLWAEQNPVSWWEAFKFTVNAALARSNRSSGDIAMIGMLGMGHGPVLVDADGKPVFPCLIWSDLRAKRQAEVLRSKAKELGIEKNLDGVLQGWYTAAKLLWIKENYPEKFERVHKILLPKDYVRLKLTGGFCTDYVDASGTQLYDTRRRNWSAEMLELLKIPREKMPEIREMNEVVGHVTTSGAKETGLETETKVLAGTGDWGTMTAGLGALDSGDGFLYCGTSPSFCVVVDRDIQDDTLFGTGMGCYAYGNFADRWVLEGRLSAAQSALSWYVDQFESGSGNHMGETEGAFDKVEADATAIEPGAGGLFFLPHMMGERFPQNPDARAVLYGLSLGHTKMHIARSIYEGIAFSLRRVMKFIEASYGIRLRTIRAFGGGTKSQLLMSIVANVTGTSLILPAEDEVGSLGLALIAAAVLQQSYPRGIYDRTIGTATIIQPERRLVKEYEKLYQIYEKIEEDATRLYPHTATLD